MDREGNGLCLSPPVSVAHFLKTLPEFAETSVLLSTSTDIDLSGEQAAEWLIVTAERVGIVSEAPSLLRQVPVARAESFRAKDAVGSGFLQARIDGGWIDLLRYSKRLSLRFASIARKLEQLKREGRLELDLEEKVGERCPSCGNTLRNAGDVCSRCIDRRAVLRRIWALAGPHRRGAAGLFFLLFTGVLVELIPPKLQQYLVDHVLSPGGAEGGAATLVVIVLSLGVSRLLATSLSETKGLLAQRIGTAFTVELRSRMVSKLHQLPLAFYDQRQVGALVSRVDHDTEALHGLIEHLTSGFLLQVLQFIGVGIMLFTLNPELAFYTLLPTPLVVAASFAFWKYVYPKYYRYWDARAKQSAGLTAMISGIRVVKAFAQERRELESFRVSSEQLRRTSLEVATSVHLFGLITALVFNLGGLIVWYAGGREVLSGEMTLGALMAFLAYLAMFYAPLSTLAQLTTWMTGFMTASSRIFELLDAPAELGERDRPKTLAARAGAITFEDVTFGYERRAPVLEDISLTIPLGQTVGIVGNSGSGKTTLVNLMCRFYDVGKGRVSIDGVDVRDLSQESLHRQIGIVLHETSLLRGTVRENLSYGKADVSPKEMISAAKAARAHELIMKLPFGYETPISERGASLSGGERQRLAIARALLYQPSILILDEATSNLDLESEQAIQDELAELFRGRTLIVIAHRLSALRRVSRILVFERGRLVEDGAPHELLAKNGVYAALYRRQSLGGETKAPEVELPATEDRPRAEPRWLTPDAARIGRGEHGQVVLEVAGSIFSVEAALAFPTRRGAWICLSDLLSGEELGIISELEAWSSDARVLIEESLGRRYHLPVIEVIEHIEQTVDLLLFRVQTRSGPRQFTMRWSETEAQDYGDSGKLLTDVDENQWLVTDVDALPKRQRALFRRFIYW
jgi:ATP-binding cassette subfamily B protein